MAEWGLGLLLGISWGMVGCGGGSDPQQSTPVFSQPASVLPENPDDWACESAPSRSRRSTSGAVAPNRGQPLPEALRNPPPPSD